MLSASDTRREAPDQEAVATTELEVTGMHCSACATRIQRALSRRSEVVSASVNPVTNRAFVAYQADAAAPPDFCATVDDLGYGAHEVGAPETAVAKDPDHWATRVAISWPLALAALAVSVLAPGGQLSGWTVLGMAVAVELVGGWPFLRRSVTLARHGATSMDTLISLGTLAALAVSAVEAVALGGAHLHVGGPGAFAARLHGVMAPLIVAVLATGRLVEARARGRAGAALQALMALRPPQARLVTSSEDPGRLVPPESVPVGALLRVRPHEALPLDGVVVEGWSAVDESMLTGEPMPKDRGPGDQVTGGTRNGSGTLVVRVEATASEGLLARLQRLVEEAQRDRPPLQRLADRISAVFVPVVLLGALVTFLAWWIVGGNPGTAVLSAVAVLLVACPCAMGLATPVAMVVGTARAATLGIAVRGGDALERLGRCDTVAFDKTGTLTERSARVTAVVAEGGTTPAEVLAWAAAVEADSDHPLAAAITQAKAEDAFEETLSATALEVIPGRGVAGLVGSRRVEVAAPGAEGLSPALAEAADEGWGRGETVVAVRVDERIVGVVSVTTPLRREAVSAVQALHHMGLATTVVSGDSEPAVASVAETVGIESHRSALDPAQKLDVLRDLQGAGHQVVMVGDGVNDAPALAAATVGVAIGSGSEAALANSDVALLGSDLHGVPAAIATARSVSAVIVQNFGWAMGYNLSALPLAAAGLLDPLVAAVAMGLSSLLVVLNSLRLVRLGRGGIEAVRPPRVARGLRGFLLAVAVPVALFASVTVVAETFSPSRGQSLLPTLPSISTVGLPHGVQAEMYLGTSEAGVNQFHLLFSITAAGGPSIARPTARAIQGTRTLGLRLVKIAPEHYLAYTVLGAGTWHFDVQVAVDGRSASASMTRTLS